MSKRLEDFIRNNKEQFDDLEPSAGLWGRIESNLPPHFTGAKQHRTFSLRFVLVLAASVILVMGIGFMFYVNANKVQRVDLADINPLYAQQQVQYTSLIETKRSELKTLSKTDPQLYKEFSAEIAKMDSTYKELNNELLNSPNQERVLHAMIRNLQIQTQVLNQQLNVIEQYNQHKATNNHEVKAI